MNIAAAAAAVVVVAAAAAVVRRQGQDAQGQEQQDEAGTLGTLAENLSEWTNDVKDTLQMLRLSNMRSVTAADVQHPQVRAFLAVIRRGEGTAGPDGYRTMFGGGLFEGFADHPRQRITRTMGGRAITSTAAGAYQFLSRTWDETARIMGLPDFSPGNQDRGAVGRIAARGALDDVKAGRLAEAMRKTALEWASLPGSPYGQPTISATTAAQVFATAGGKTMA